MELDQAFELISRAIDAGKAANGYLIVGDLNGNAMELVERILKRIFPGAVEQVEHHCHPDVAVLKPEGKLRIIRGGSMRDQIVNPMTQTAFAGGWKVGVIVSADRLNGTSANAFLKVLEEPPPRTMFLLLTDQPNALLPTIVSRVQRFDLPLSEGLLEGAAYDSVAEAFAARDGKRLAALLEKWEKETDVENVPLLRKQFFKTLMSFVRKIMLGGGLPDYVAFHNVEAVEQAYRQCDISMNKEAVLGFLMDRLRFPAAKG